MTIRHRPSNDVAPVSVRTHAVFLDFDGTLAPLQEDPDTVALPDGGVATLLALHQQLTEALVLISGRDIRDLSTRTPVELWRAGGHGLEVCEPGQVPSLERAEIAADLRTQVDAVVALHSGVRIEDKGPVLAIHYRQNPKAGAPLLDALQAIADQVPNYKAQHGKMVIELKPVAANKGIALASIMQRTPFVGRVPIMVGDDTTDEDAMQAATDLGGFGIKVGEGETCAKFRMMDTRAVWDWLKGIVDEHA